MSYEIILHPDVTRKDLKQLSKKQVALVFKQFKKIQQSPQLGKLLGNKSGYDLSGYRKMYVDKKQIRIVYTIKEEIVTVEVVSVGKREDMEVYAKAAERR